MTNNTISVTPDAKKPLLDWRWLLIITLVPLIVAGGYLLLVQILRIDTLRFDPQYFTEEYVTRYNSPSTVIIDLEQALRTEDYATMRALEGLRRPTWFETRPTMRVTILYDADDYYFHYLFFDTRTYERFAHHVEQINGRWVVAPEDVVYYYKSGEWRDTWMPLAVNYWVIEIVVVLVMVFYRLTRSWREETFGY